VIKSGGGGCNAILVRGDTVLEHRWRRLCIWPERRWVHGVRLRDAGLWVANLHGGGPMRDAARAVESVVAWTGPDAPIVLGGDFNIRQPSLEGFDHAGGFSVDHMFVRGLAPAGQPEILERGPLSDHAPVAVAITTVRAPGPYSPAPRSPDPPSP
jgi:endonuclease/exonuclease/phosphatase family metal-dependent hydrolase